MLVHDELTEFVTRVRAVGKGGQVIKEMIDTSGASIKVSQKGEYAPGTTNRTITITGEPIVAYSQDRFLRFSQKLIIRINLFDHMIKVQLCGFINFPDRSTTWQTHVDCGRSTIWQPYGNLTSIVVDRRLGNPTAT